MVKFFTKAIKSFFKRIKDTHVGYVCDRAARKYNTDWRIQYPSYKTMDNYIDIEKLRSLDSIIIQFIENYLKKPPKHDDRFNTGPFSLKFWHPKVIKSHLVALTVNKSGGLYNYFDLNKSEKWELTDYAKQLPEVIRFIKKLPFEAIGRIMLMFDTGQQSIFPHRDHVSAEMCHEFIWFTANKKKKFYVYHDGLKEYITSYSAWFDTVNQFHGADPAGELNYSIRVDGVFTDEFRKKIPCPEINPASTPSLWASLESEGCQ